MDYLFFCSAARETHHLDDLIYLIIVFKLRIIYFFMVQMLISANDNYTTWEIELLYEIPF